MLIVDYKPEFLRKISKIKDGLVRKRIKNQISKIIENPEIGKPMRNVMKGTREIYISPFRLSYSYLREESKIVILDFYHKSFQ